jgi:hypothetical protein
VAGEDPAGASFALSDPAELLVPRGLVRAPGRRPRVLRAAMPVASVYEDGHLRLGEVDVEREPLADSSVHSIAQTSPVKCSP